MLSQTESKSPCGSVLPWLMRMVCSCVQIGNITLPVSCVMCGWSIAILSTTISVIKRETDSSVPSRNRWLEHQGKRVALQERLQRDVLYEGTVAKAPPCPERRMRTPVPQQSSSSTREEESPWSGHERTALARMEKYVKNSECIQLDIDEVEEWSFGPEYANIDVQQI